MDAPNSEFNHAALSRFIRDNDVRTVSVVSPDLHGYARGKQVTAEQFLARSDNPIQLSTLFATLDCGNYPIEPPVDDDWWPSWAHGYADSYAQVDPETFRLVPWQGNTALILCDFIPVDRSTSLAFLPRNLLRQLVKRFEALHFDIKIGLECEFCLFEKPTALTGGEQRRELTPLWPGLQAYLVTTLGKHHSFIKPLIDNLIDFGIKIDSWHSEAGPGQLEITLAPQNALLAAENAFLFKHAIKEISAQAGLLASFMAQISDPGFSNGCHVNLSLWRDGKNLFFEPNGLSNQTKLMHHFIAGVVATLPELTLLYAPTPNSYRRFKPYQWTGMQAAWANDNKSVAVRAISNNEAGTRIEQRTGGSDANPFLLACALLAGGLHGIENQLVPAPPVVGDAYKQPDIRSVPRNINQAIDLFADSAVAHKYLGRDFVRFFTLTRRRESSLFVESSHTDENCGVTRWELERYLELI